MAADSSSRGASALPWKAVTASMSGAMPSHCGEVKNSWDQAMDSFLK